jgi:hypothetical protein
MKNNQTQQEQQLQELIAKLNSIAVNLNETIREIKPIEVDSNFNFFFCFTFTQKDSKKCTRFIYGDEKQLSDIISDTLADVLFS